MISMHIQEGAHFSTTASFLGRNQAAQYEISTGASALRIRGEVLH